MSYLVRYIGGPRDGALEQVQNVPLTMEFPGMSLPPRIEYGDDPTPPAAMFTETIVYGRHGDPVTIPDIGEVQLFVYRGVTA